MSEELLKMFMDWSKEQKRTIRGGVAYFNIPGHYRNIKETDLFDFWVKNVHRKLTE